MRRHRPQAARRCTGLRQEAGGGILLPVRQVAANVHRTHTRQMPVGERGISDALDMRSATAKEPPASSTRRVQHAMRVLFFDEIDHSARTGAI